MKISYYGHFFKPTGYAQAAHDYAMALIGAGVDLEIVPLTDCDTNSLDPYYFPLLDHVRAVGGKRVTDKSETHRIVHTMPAYARCFVTGEHEPGDDVKRICITTWETDRLPEGFADNLKTFDCLIAPSTWCARVLSLSTGRAVLCVPHTFDPGRWPVQKNPPPEIPYRFLAVLSWSERKNPIGLLKAYWSAFPHGESVELNVLTPFYSKEDVAALAARMGLSNFAPVYFITERQSHEQLLSWYHNSHCYVSATRGEAWHLPAFEAAILGKGVICTNWSGHRDFLGEYGGWQPIPVLLTPAVPADAQIAKPMTVCGVRIQPIHEVAPCGINARQFWAEPGLEYMREKMRQVWSGQNLLHPKGGHTRQDFEAKYGYPAVARKFRELLENENLWKGARICKS